MPLHILDNLGYPQGRNLYSLKEDRLYFPGPRASSPENGQDFSKYGGAYINTACFFPLHFVRFSFCYSKYLKMYVVKMNYKIY